MIRGVALAAAFALSACAGKTVDPSPANSAPLPAQIDIAPVSGDAPPGLAALSGSWAGRWQDTQDSRVSIDHRLVVQKFNGTDVQLIYAWGEQIRGPAPGFAYLVGKLDENGAIRLDLGNGVQVVYRASGDGRVFGDYNHAGRTSRAILTRR